MQKKAMCMIHKLTFHVIRLQRVTDIQCGHPQQHIWLEGLMAPDTKHQFTEGSNDSVGNMRLLNSNLDDNSLYYNSYFSSLDQTVLNGHPHAESKVASHGQWMSITVTVAPFRQSCQQPQEKQNMICGCCDLIASSSKRMLGNSGLANHMGLREHLAENNMVHRLKLRWHLMCEYVNCYESSWESVMAYVSKQESWNITRHSLTASWHFPTRC